MQHAREIGEAIVYGVAIIYAFLAQHLEPTLHWVSLVIGIVGGLLLLRQRWLKNRTLEIERAIAEEHLRRLTSAGTD